MDENIPRRPVKGPKDPNGRCFFFPPNVRVSEPAIELHHLQLKGTKMVRSKEDDPMYIYDDPKKEPSFPL